MRKRDYVGPDGVKTFQAQQLRCGECNAIFDLDLEVNVEMSRAIAQMKAMRCPHCDSRKLLMGQSRTLAEDRRFRSEGTVEQRAVLWEANGEIGLSSDAIRLHMLGQARPGMEMSAPRDAGDLRRCVLLLHRIPEWQSRMPEMAAYLEWGTIAGRWSEIWTTFHDEVGADLEGNSAPRTAALIP